MLAVQSDSSSFVGSVGTGWTLRAVEFFRRGHLLSVSLHMVTCSARVSVHLGQDQCWTNPIFCSCRDAHQQTPLRDCGVVCRTVIKLLGTRRVSTAVLPKSFLRYGTCLSLVHARSAASGGHLRRAPRSWLFVSAGGCRPAKSSRYLHQSRNGPTFAVLSLVGSSRAPKNQAYLGRVPRVVDLSWTGRRFLATFLRRLALDEGNVPCRCPSLCLMAHHLSRWVCSPRLASAICGEIVLRRKLFS